MQNKSPTKNNQMKTKLSVLLLLTNLLSHSQETDFNFTKDGMTDYVVTEIKGKTKAQLYQKTLEWMPIWFIPQDVITYQQEDDCIRIESNVGLALPFLNNSMRSYNKGRYVLEISFEDGKYLFDVVKLEHLVSLSPNYNGLWIEIKMDKDYIIYDKNRRINSSFKDYPKAIISSFNGLNMSLEDFILTNLK